MFRNSTKYSDQIHIPSEEVIRQPNWKREIEWSFNEGRALKSIFMDVNPRGDFLETIWQMSLTAFDKPREVQVVVDNNNNLFISYGTFSFVDFQNEDVIGMKLPIKCWIHTHPFGSAYFSGTDMRTINTWKTIMLSAIVLGEDEHQTWMNTSPNEATHYRYAKIKKIKLNGGEEE